MRRFLLLLLFFSASIGSAFTQEGASAATVCIINGPSYGLNSDTVKWEMSVGSGQSCFRGLRINLATLDEMTLISPPQNGRVTFEGPAFYYRGDPNFVGEDSFTLAISGKINKIKGSSTIRVVVYVIK